MEEIQLGSDWVEKNELGNDRGKKFVRKWQSGKRASGSETVWKSVLGNYCVEKSELESDGVEEIELGTGWVRVCEWV